MVTADRHDLCVRAVWCYQQQTYANKELVVLDNGHRAMDALLVDLPADEVRYKKIARTPDLILGDTRSGTTTIGTIRIVSSYRSMCSTRATMPVPSPAP